MNQAMTAAKRRQLARELDTRARYLRLTGVTPQNGQDSTVGGTEHERLR